MRISKVDSKPLSVLHYQTSGSKGKRVNRVLPIYWVKAVGLPANIRCMVITSDLQGRERGGMQRLLGELLAEHLGALQQKGEIPSLSVVALCGDLYEYPDCHKRGGTGPVDLVWRAFASVAGQVVGVHGNHDTLEAPDHLPGNVHILDGDAVNIDGLTIGGVSGIVGDPNRHQRRAEADYLAVLERVTREAPDLLLLHQGPDDPESQRRGEPMVRLSLATGYAGLTAFGHSFWPDRYVIDLGQGQAVNVDSRVLVVRPAD